jgi:hypothetical protein
MRVVCLAVFVLLGEKCVIYMLSFLCVSLNFMYARIFMLVTSVPANSANLKHFVYVCLQEVGACVLLWHERCM